jgi:hypothetical protein
MRKAIVASTVALAAFFAVGSEAKAADWGLHSGDTLRSGDNMLYGEVGWPDLSFGFQHGMSSAVDLGFRFSLLYGADYSTATRIGMGMRVPIRIAAVKRDKFSLMFHIDPGIKFTSFGRCNSLGCATHTYNDGLGFGIWFPLGLEFGIHLTREATLQFGMEMPIYVNLTNGTYGNIPILFGPGFEYAVDQHIAVGFNTRFGPDIFAASDNLGNTYSYTGFGLIAQAYFAYRL